METTKAKTPVTPMRENEPMGWGKHKHDKLGDVPAEYLLWAYATPNIMRIRPKLRAYIEQNKKHLEQEAQTIASKRIRKHKI